MLCITTVQLEVCRTCSGRGMGMNITAHRPGLLPVPVNEFAMSLSLKQFPVLLKSISLWWSGRTRPVLPVPDRDDGGVGALRGREGAVGRELRRGCTHRRALDTPWSDRDKWGQHWWGHCKLYVVDGTFWVLPLTYFHIPQCARAYLFPLSFKNNCACSGPVSVDPICPQPNPQKNSWHPFQRGLPRAILIVRLRTASDESSK